MLLFYLDTPRLHQEISSYNDLNQQNGILGEGIDPHLQLLDQEKESHRRAGADNTTGTDSGAVTAGAVTAGAVKRGARAAAASQKKKN